MTADLPHHRARDRARARRPPSQPAFAVLRLAHVVPAAGVTRVTGSCSPPRSARWAGAAVDVWSTWVRGPRDKCGCAWSPARSRSLRRAPRGAGRMCASPRAELDLGALAVARYWSTPMTRRPRRVGRCPARHQPPPKTRRCESGAEMGALPKDRALQSFPLLTLLPGRRGRQSYWWSERPRAHPLQLLPPPQSRQSTRTPRHRASPHVRHPRIRIERRQRKVS